MTTPALYLSGPMTGYPEFNFPAFATAAARLRAVGYEVHSPHEIDAADQTWQEFLRLDLILMLERCSAVATLDGWTESKGATLEVDVAMRLGWTVRRADEWIADRCNAQVAS